MFVTTLTSRLPYAPRFESFQIAPASNWRQVISNDVCDRGNIVRLGGTPTIAECVDALPNITLAADNMRISRLIGGGFIGSARVSQIIQHDVARDLGIGNSSEVIALTVISGSGRIVQDGVTMPVAPGDVVFRHTREPSKVMADSIMDVVVVRVPVHRFFGAWFGQHKRCEPRLVSRDAPAAAMVADVAPVMMERMTRMSAAGVYFTEQAMIRMLAAAYVDTGTSVYSRTADLARWERLTGFIDAQACDPELTLECVAGAVGISKRFVHKLFEQHGIRYGAYLLSRRLELARAQLEDVNLQHLKVSEIAYRSGFNDPSHFSRTFRFQYHISPTDYRVHTVKQAFLTNR